MNTGNAGDNAAITAILPTYNRARALEVVWPSYAKDSLVTKIIVVNDGGQDDTSEVVKRLARQSSTPVQLIEHAMNLGTPVARRTAIAQVDSEWVLFGEDDVYLGPGYISVLLRQALDLGADVIAGRLVTARVPGAFSPDSLPQAYSQVAELVFDLGLLEVDFSLRPPCPQGVPFLHAVVLVRRELFSEINYDPWYGGGNAYREETDFCLSANAQGCRVVFTPDATCFHLRGPLAATGGQRINRLAVEYYNIRNSYHMVAKHWPYLEKQLGFRGMPLTWTMSYAWRRELRQVRRILKSGFRSSFQG